MHVYPVELALPLGYRFDPQKGYVAKCFETLPFVIRTISRKQYRSWTEYNQSMSFLEERVLEECVLSYPAYFGGQPWDWEEIPAGIVDQLVKQVLNMSGWGEAPSPVIQQRVQDYLESEEAKYDLLIMTAFPYKREELEEMDLEDWQALAGMAPIKLAVVGIDPNLILDPKGARKTGPSGSGASPNVQGLPQHGKQVAEEASLNISNGQVLHNQGFNKLGRGFG